MYSDIANLKASAQSPLAIKSLFHFTQGEEQLTPCEAADNDIQITVDSHVDESEPPPMQEE
jgi:hypothetical protein